MRIDANGVHYRDLNDRIHAAIEGGERRFTLDNVRGQRYIGAGLNNGVHITINGVPGNDLGAFMNGAAVTVHGNGQDGVGITMNAGKVVIHGDAGWWMPVYALSLSVAATLVASIYPARFATRTDPADALRVV